MDFGALPPEANSGRMYAGPGAGPMLAAAAAWARLAAELGTAARGYESVVTELTGQAWLGPTAESMAAAAAPYAAWMSATATQAQQTATQATAAASAFEEAHAAVVPPPVIAANRSELASLVATNVLGQNSAAIAAVEAQYLQMWVQDVVAMYGYAGRSAAAAAVTPFSEPPPTANPGGLVGPAAAVAHAATGSAHSQLTGLITAMPQTLHGLASTAGSAAPLAGGLGTLQSTPSLTQIISYVELIEKSIIPFNDAIKTILYALLQSSRNLTIALDQAAAASGAEALAAAQSTGLGGVAPTVSAVSGSAGLVGKLSVPPGWAETAPEVKMTAAAAAGTSSTAAPAVAAAPGGLFADMALAGLLGRTIAGTAPRSSPAAVMNGHAHGRLQRLVTELAGTHEVQHWHVDPSRLDSLLEELSEKPGVHAVHVNDDGTESKFPPQSS